ncbi:MAG: HD family hydrolase [Ardenticatenales bacterium]|nr:HD family hydrolase [Ardenticatenales bacterium]
MPQFLDVALHAAQLKRMPRTGWQIRGAPSGGVPENVAAHSYGVVFLTMLLLDLDERPLDHGLALRLAVLHDLAESLVGDLPVTVSRFIPPDLKHTAERAAIAEIVEPLPMAARYIEIWECYDDGSAPEAQVVKDADKLDMMIQAYMYEQAGQRNLDEFWEVVSGNAFYTEGARTLFEELLRRRAALAAR